MSEITPNLTPAQVAAHPLVAGSRALAVGSLLGLIVLGLLWELWLAPTGQGTLAVKVLPLVIPLAGLLRHRLYTYRWVSLLVWLYCAEGLVRGFSARPIEALLAWIEVGLCLCLFTACALQVRVRLRLAKQATAP
jgi:uncharacterized membrane protein